MTVNVWQFLLNIVGFAALGIAGYFIIRSKVAIANQALAEKNLKELERLVGIRGDHITELEHAVARAEDKIRQLEAIVSEMRGQMQAIQGIKAQEIAVEVARLLGQS